jgi:DNA repair photolyase
MTGLFAESIDSRRRRGRGAAVNPAGRFERLRAEPVDDGWEIEEELAPVRTRVTVDRSRSVLVRNTSPDVPFDRSLNPYRGCEHGCTYCYARPSHAFLGLSPGLDFETRLVAKPDAPRLLEAAIRKPGYRVAPIAIGTNTDPYQPIEKTWRIMRGVLEVLRDHRHPVMITTKGSLVTRDLDILRPMGRAGLAHVQVSLTTLDPHLSRAMEPRARVRGGGWR